jgi:phosphinothricin acetyltransferase
MNAFEIGPLEPADWDAVRAIYLEGISTGNATFEKAAPDWEKWDREHLRACRVAARAAAGATLSCWSAAARLSACSRRQEEIGHAMIPVAKTGAPKRILESLDIQDCARR